MRILLGAHHYPPRYVAGVELIVARLARRLTERGHQVEVVCVEEIDAAVPLSVTDDWHEGIHVHRLGLQLTGQPVGLGVRYRDDLLGRWFAGFLRRQRPDVFHSHGSYLLTASPLVAARQAGVATVVTLHDYWFLCPRLTLLRSDGHPCAPGASAADCAWCLLGERRRFRAVDAVRRRMGKRAGSPDAVPWRWLDDRNLTRLMTARQHDLPRHLRLADAVVSPAPLARELLIRQGFPSDAVCLIRYGLDPIGAGPARSPRPAGRLRVGYLGQIAPHKGVHVLVAACTRLMATTPGLDLEIHGDLARFPDYVRRLRAATAGAAGIRLMGAFDNARVGEILRDLDVVVVPSLWYEVSPVVILEAFAAGVPVVASRSTNLASLVRDERDGLLFTPGDVPDLARQLQRLAREPGLLPRLARGIRPMRTVADEVDDLEALYRSLLARPGTDGSMAEAVGVTGRPEPGSIDG